MLSYSGETDENNTPHGIGVMIMKNGDIYKGSFTHGKRHGEGALITKRGVKIGKWKDNHEDGELKEVKNDEKEETQLENGDIENGIVKIQQSGKGARAPMQSSKKPAQKNDTPLQIKSERKEFSDAKTVKKLDKATGGSIAQIVLSLSVFAPALFGDIDFEDLQKKFENQDWKALSQDPNVQIFAVVFAIYLVICYFTGSYKAIAEMKD